MIENPVALIVEDDEDDLFFLQKAFDELDSPYKPSLHFARDGEELMEYLKSNRLPD